MRIAPFEGPNAPTGNQYRALLAVSEAILSHYHLPALFHELAGLLHQVVPLRGAAVGLASLLRTEGGSVGTSLAQTVEQRREQFHLARLNDWLGTLNPHVQGFFEAIRSVFDQRTGDPSRSRLMSLQSLDGLPQQQAASLANFDVFWLCAVLSAVLVVLVLLMKRSVAEKGEHIGAE